MKGLGVYLAAIGAELFMYVVVENLGAILSLDPFNFSLDALKCFQ